MAELTAEALEESAEPLLFRGGLDVRNFVQVRWSAYRLLAPRTAARCHVSHAPSTARLRLISLPRPMQRYDDWGNPIKGNLLGVNPKAFRRKLKKKYIRIPAVDSISKSLLLILQ